MKKDFIWNMAGSLLYAFSSMCMAFFATRLFGIDDGGIFGFGFSTLGQQMFIIAYFGLRAFHITDVATGYTFGQYRLFRKRTSALAGIFAVAYLILFFLLGKYDLYKVLALYLLCLYKIVDGYADAYECECQRDGRLYIGGRALFFRTLVSMGGFLLVAFMSRDLLSAVGFAVICQFAGLLLFNVSGFRKGVPRDRYSLKVDEAAIKRLLADGMPLFLSVFLDFYIFSSAKYAIDWLATDADSAVFNILFMPTNVIYLIANLAIRPFMTELAEAYERKRKARFYSVTGRLLLMIAAFIAVALVGTVLLGRPVLRIFELLLGDGYKDVFTDRWLEFFLVILGGGLYAVSDFFYYLLVIARKQDLIFGIYLVGALFAFILSFYFVGNYGLAGAAASYALLMLLLTVAFLGLGSWAIKKGLENR